jgi:CheY-like chemotaxis protein
MRSLKRNEKWIIKMNEEADNPLVLVIDDEEMVARATCDMLEHLGYRTASSSSGKAGVEYYKKHPDEVDLIILDCRLSDLPGALVFDQIRSINPKQNILLATGLGLDETTSEMMSKGCDNYIQKPYGLKKLSETLEQIRITH